MAGDVNTSVALDLNIDTNAPEQIAAVTEQVQGGVEAFKTLRTETRALTGDVLTATKGTAEYNEQLNALAQHRAQFLDLRQDIRALDPREQTIAMARFGETGVRALSGIGGAAALAAGGNEKMMKVMMEGFAVTQVMESAMAIGELKHQAASVKNLVYQKLLTAGYIEQGAAVTGLTIAQGILNAVTSAWPLGLLFAGIAAFVLYVKTFNSGIDSMVEAEQTKIDKLEEEKTELEANEKLSAKIATNAENRAKAEGKSIREIRDARDQALLNRIKDAEKEIDLEYKEMDRISDKNALLTQQINIWDEIKLATGLITEDEYLKDKVDNEAIEANNKLLKEKRDAIKNLKADEDAIKIQQIQNKKDDADADKKTAAEARKTSKENQDQMLADLEGFQDAETRQNDRFAEQKLKDDKRAYDAETLLIMQEVKTEQDKLDAKNAKELADAKTLADEKKQIKTAELQVVTSFTEAAVSMGDLLLAKGKQQTDGTKALALIQIGIKEALSIAGIVEAVIAANAETPTPATPFLIASEIAGGIAGVVASFVSAKSVLDGGSASSSSTSVGSYSAPSISNSTQFGGNPQTNQNGQTDYGYNAASKVYVSQTDLNAAQATAYYQNLQRRKH